MKVAIFGGDKRMLFAARAFMNEGHEVFVAGFDNLMSLCEIQVCGIAQAAERCDIAVLPVRPITDGCLNMPFSEEKTQIPELMKMIGEKPVFSGCADQIQPYVSGKVSDYAAREDFLWRNAELTAEGAIGLLMDGYEGAVFGTDILVTGYGRIGKCLSSYLKAMGANVTVAARKLSDRAMIALSGIQAVDYPETDCSAYQVIFNTVPALVLDESAIDRMREDVYIIDLASKPGGVDFQRAEERNLTCIHALSLPGKTAPLAAGTIIKETILKMMKES